MITWLFTQVWLWSLAAFALGALITWLLFARPLRRRLAEADQPPADHDYDYDAPADHPSVADAPLDLLEPPPPRWDNEPTIGDWERRPRAWVAPEQHEPDSNTWFRRKDEETAQHAPEPDTAVTAVQPRVRVDDPDTAAPRWPEAEPAPKTPPAGEQKPAVAHQQAAGPKVTGATEAAEPLGRPQVEPQQQATAQVGQQTAGPRKQTDPKVRAAELRTLAGLVRQQERTAPAASEQKATPTAGAPEQANPTSESRITGMLDAESAEPAQSRLSGEPRSLFEPAEDGRPATPNVPSAADDATQVLPKIDDDAAESAPLPRRTPGAGPRPGREKGGSGPMIKGHSASRQYHSPESPQYDQIVADVWFRTPADAEIAGFAPWNGQRAT
ncbi:hypothetical protein GCM10011581_33280 [Saccharopolyspora subtropica]|uniref:Uncharacterized protein n=1 Tax=Saccharopolyspora thermophila TaxID=89367 RepID=A0A917K1J5_9PSEU|nr:hypothetical protein [Saccharopolyspora subtropica]GGI93562.1 hypothetical protein GCM10011581_33280 [Saccharopolyspora subtropica]